MNAKIVQRELNMLKDAMDKITELQAENAELKAWKESAIAIMSPMQEIGNELGIMLGESIHDKILPAIQVMKIRESKLRKCVELYAKQALWQKWLGEQQLWVSTVGPKPAQKCLEELKHGE